MGRQQTTDLDSREHHGSISVGKPRRDPLADALSLPVVLRVVAGEAVQDEDLPPLRALVQGREELVDGGGVHLYERLAGAAALVDL